MNSELGSLFFLIALCGFCRAEVYKVGDSTGWAIIGNMDYNKWASSKSFQLGDTLVFQYDPRYHNVLEVSRSDFHTCDTTAPIATFSTGNDSIQIRSPGHYYYTCGFVGHCQAGQKVDIRVTKTGRAAAIPISSPIQARNGSAVPLASSTGRLAPSPSSSNGQSQIYFNGLFGFSGAFFLFLVWAFSYGFL